jgi:glutathione S-transferase
MSPPAGGVTTGDDGTMSKYKLTYFDIRGLAETSRWIFKVAKVPFEDNRFSFTFGVPGDFSTIKRPEFDAAKKAGELDVSLGKLPVLEVDGVKIGQSKAIERFLARQFGLMGASAVEAAHIEMLCEHIVDFKSAYQKVRGISDAAEKDKKTQEWFAETLPEHVAAAEKSLQVSGPGPFLVGSKVSLADLSWYSFLAAPKGFFDNTEGAKAAFQKCPRIKAAMAAVDAIPELQEWLKVRPDSMF